jgi:hypothetical protein
MNKHYHEQDWTNDPVDVYRLDFAVMCKNFRFVPVLTVRGYNLSRQVAMRSNIYGGSVSMETDAIRDLFTKKQALLLELRNYEGNNQFSEIDAGDMGQQLAAVNQHVGIIPVRYIAVWRNAFCLYLLQLMVSVISVPCLISLYINVYCFLVYFSGPNKTSDWHCYQHGY